MEYEFQYDQQPIICSICSICTVGPWRRSSHQAVVINSG